MKTLFLLAMVLTGIAIACGGQERVRASGAYDPTCVATEFVTGRYYRCDNMEAVCYVNNIGLSCFKK